MGTNRWAWASACVWHCRRGRWYPAWRRGWYRYPKWTATWKCKSWDPMTGRNRSSRPRIPGCRTRRIRSNLASLPENQQFVRTVKAARHKTAQKVNKQNTADKMIITRRRWYRRCKISFSNQIKAKNVIIINSIPRLYFSISLDTNRWLHNRLIAIKKFIKFNLTNRSDVTINYINQKYISNVSSLTVKLAINRWKISQN